MATLWPGDPGRESSGPKRAILALVITTGLALILASCDCFASPDFVNSRGTVL